MSRKSFYLGIALLILLGASVAGALVLLVRHEPDFYNRIALPPGQERQKHSQEFQANCTQLINAMINYREWEEKFTESQINSYLDEDFIRSGICERMLPKGISNPRVHFGPGTVRMAFRYGTDTWCSSVVTIDFKVWLCPQEPNVVAMELQGLHAGSLPISAQSLLEQVAQVARQQDIEVTWYRQNGNPVALLRFQANQARPTVRVERLQLTDGQLVVGGRSLDSSASPVRAMLGVPPLAMESAAD